jgi:hypothetical protein
LLFEEPELYLYPRAQQILFGALSKFATDNVVLVTTHSPIFFSAEATASFTKLVKLRADIVGPKPFSVALPIDLSDMKTKDQFQIICYENNNAAFFSSTITLVEGDSDYVVLPHLALTINPDWNCGNASLTFARINGKSSISRYRGFFARFATRVCVMADLDVLINGFDQLGACPEIQRVHSQLLAAIDKALEAAPRKEPNAKMLQAANDSGDLRSKWARAKELIQKARADAARWPEAQKAVDDFLAWERKNLRLEELKNPASGEVKNLKEDLLMRLRRHDVFILSRGAIEDYYPTDVTHSDKPTMAQEFCRRVSTREDALGLCPNVRDEEGTGGEFEAVFSRLFSAHDTSADILARFVAKHAKADNCPYCNTADKVSATAPATSQN